jgi:hypothetical protein
MPREKVEGIEGFTVQVGWSSGGSMQLGIEVAEGTTIIHQLYGGDPSLERIGRRAVEAGWKTEIPVADEPADVIAEFYRQVGHEVLNAVEGPLNESTGYRAEEFRELWATLTRHSANSLVRYLRKARDSVFGRDE